MLSCFIFPDSSVGKESACNAGDPSSIPGLGRSAGEGIGYPLWQVASVGSLCDPTDHSPPGSSVHGILQARIPEWVAMSSCKGFLIQGSKLPLLRLLALAGDSLPLRPLGNPTVSIAEYLINEGETLMLD